MAIQDNISTCFLNEKLKAPTRISIVGSSSVGSVK